MNKRQVIEFIKFPLSPILTFFLGLILPPYTDPILDPSMTPQKLAGYLENGEIFDFNTKRGELKEEIKFESIDLTNKTLSNVDLKSLIMLNSNLSNSNLENLKFRKLSIFRRHNKYRPREIPFSPVQI